ncbi:hypothetical protein DFH06DRAFT_1234421 [Mycena polygramma]|nr:hypothetical protein DFH06DRAFT_1234421 [Mycena polygramma]
MCSTRLSIHTATRSYGAKRRVVRLHAFQYLQRIFPRSLVASQRVRTAAPSFLPCSDNRSLVVSHRDSVASAPFPPLRPQVPSARLVVVYPQPLSSRSVSRTYGRCIIELLRVHRRPMPLERATPLKLTDDTGRPRQAHACARIILYASFLLWLARLYSIGSLCSISWRLRSRLHLSDVSAVCIASRTARVDRIQIVCARAWAFARRVSLQPNSTVTERLPHRRQLRFRGGRTRDVERRDSG